MSVSFVVAARAAGYVAVQSAADPVYGLTSARFWATSVALLGLAGAVVGGLALARSARRTGDGGRRRAVVALVTGAIALAGGALNLTVADGGPGTGNGVVAGALALVLGLTGLILGRLALTRSRRTG
ncbi:DUF6223 family protein [Streptomyces sp. WMMB 322]|uniref:DUF6223 family protein n=1 Tax=Streptomyces sp. WMMB 322 TaxID=1286821 RepID=UPI0006E284F4|nr:DUF6223 family protein [Streptomyces sp. WMMB 322]SCK13591.1 hypothetical protein H180DRAFT_00836 [Streptomyces sp. WMMB 322]